MEVKMKLVRIDFTIKTLEDFHIGTGLDCAGLYDDGQVKDKNGNPYIRPETLKGLLKESCRQVRSVITDYQSAYSELFDYKNLGSLDVFVQYVENSALTPFIIHTFTKIDPEKGTGQDGSLRDIEFGSKGCNFKCSLEMQLKHDDEAKSVQELLELGIKNLKLIGSSRRRGFGAVKCEIAEKHTETDKNETSQLEDSQNYRILLELQDATCIAGAGQTGNIIHTMNYLSGTTALGMFRNILLKLNSAAKIFDDGRVSVTNFYPTIQDKLDDSVVIPVPLSLRMMKATDKYSTYYEGNRNIKDEEMEIPHWMLELKPKSGSKKDFLNLISRDTLIQDDNIVSSDKSLKDEYILFKDSDMDTENAEVFKPGIEIILRNRITEDLQATGDDGVFTQEMLVRGTRFVGKISFNNLSAAEEFKTLYKDWLTGDVNFHTGRGAKSIRVVDIQPIKDTTITPVTATGSDLTITLLSDMILLDDKLNPRSQLNATDLGLENELSLQNSIISTRIHQSFSGTAGLRRFSDQVITKGSCIHFSVNEGKTIDADKLIQLGMTGIGSKTDEGFGRFAVNLPLHSYQNSKPTFEASINKGIKLPKHEVDKLNKIAEQFQYIKSLDIYKIKGESTFYNKIISYMESKYDSEKIHNEICHGKETRSKDKWESFEKLFNAPELKERDDKYELIKLRFLQMKKKGGE